MNNLYQTKELVRGQLPALCVKLTDI